MRIPRSSPAKLSMASSNCARQSQRRLWNTSPVRHCEWIRTRGGGSPDRSPRTRTIASSTDALSTAPSNPKIRNCPNRVGKAASATFRNWNSEEICMERFFCSSKPTIIEDCPGGAMLIAEASESPLVTLLVKLGVVASLASILTRSSGMKRALLRELRTLNQKLRLALWFAAIFGAAVATRVATWSSVAGELGADGGLAAGGARVGGGRRLRHHAVRRRAAAEDLEQRAQ